MVEREDFAWVGDPTLGREVDETFSGYPPVLEGATQINWEAPVLNEEMEGEHSMNLAEWEEENLLSLVYREPETKKEKWSIYDLAMLLTKASEWIGYGDGLERFTEYQAVFVYRVILSVLLGDLAKVTALWARQIGKSKCMGALAAALLVFLPVFANLKDESGKYYFSRLKRFRTGFRFGAFAPILKQSDRIYEQYFLPCLERGRGRDVLDYMYINRRANRDGSLSWLRKDGPDRKASVLWVSASMTATTHPTASVEGPTLHLLLFDEAQDVQEVPYGKISPMGAAVGGTTVFIGVIGDEQMIFYKSLMRNLEKDSVETFYFGRVKDHFFVNCDDAIKVCFRDGLYQRYVEEEVAMKGGWDHPDILRNYKLSWRTFGARALVPPAVFVKGSKDYGKGYNFGSALSEVGRVVAGYDPQHGGKDDGIFLALEIDVSYPVFITGEVTVEEEEDSDTPIGRDFVGFHKNVIDLKKINGDEYTPDEKILVVEQLCSYSGVEFLAMDATGSGPGPDSTGNKPGMGDIRVTAMVDRLEDMGVTVIPINFSPKAIISNAINHLWNEWHSTRLHFPAWVSKIDELILEDGIPSKELAIWKGFKDQFTRALYKINNGRIHIFGVDKDDIITAMMLALIASSEIEESAQAVVESTRWFNRGTGMLGWEHAGDVPLLPKRTTSSYYHHI